MPEIRSPIDGKPAYHYELLDAEQALSRGAEDTARDKILDALELAPDSPDVLFVAMKVCRAEGYPEHAAEHARRFLEVADENDSRRPEAEAALEPEAPTAPGPEPGAADPFG